MINFAKASNFLKLNEEEQEVLKYGIGKHKILPVVDKLLPYASKMQDGIYLVSGGRGGAKSRTTAMKLVKECMESNYFKCFYGRKEWTTNRETTHKALVNAIKYMGVEDEFYYSEASNGTMDIRHVKTGGYFTPFGTDKEEKMKGIEDPTHIWIDEADQISHGAFSEILPTLRHGFDGARCIILTFNRYAVNKKHWIISTFYPDLYDGEEELKINVRDNYNIFDYFVNYFDNPFLPSNYRDVLWLASNGDIKKFEGLANGTWKQTTDDNLWYHAFANTIHVKDDIKRVEGLADHISIDWNVVPYMSLTAWQIHNNGEYLDFYCYQEYALESPLNTTKDIINKFISDYKQDDFSTVYYYGDAMGNRRVEGQGSYTRFKEVRELLVNYIGNSSDRSIRYNPANIKRRDLMNSILSGNFVDRKQKVRIFISSKCKKLINDYNTVKEGTGGKLVERGVYNEEKNVELNGHLSDTVDYLFASIFKHKL